MRFPYQYRLPLLTALLGVGITGSALAQEWVDVPLSDNTWFTTETSYQTGEYEVTVPAFTALEYKIAMQEGDIAVYHWTTDMAEPELLDVEFHGHTEPEEGEAGTVMFYTIHTDGEERGTLKAPFSGVHGWFLRNNTDEDITIDLKVAGFYTEVDN